MRLGFYKYEATGNDFIVIDERAQNFFLNEERIFALCQRRYGIGSDGLVSIRPSKIADARMIFYNPDGKEATLCLNALRALFVHLSGSTSIETAAGVYFGYKNSIDLPEVTVSESIDFREEQLVGTLYDTGVKHLVVETKLDTIDFISLAKQLRNHSHFAPKGVNVNCVEKISEGRMRVRTYEKGVEGETHSCGTGAYACFLHMQQPKGVIQFFHGTEIVFERFDQGVHMQGDVKRVYEGNIEITAQEMQRSHH